MANTTQSSGTSLPYRSGAAQGFSTTHRQQRARFAFRWPLAIAAVVLTVAYARHRMTVTVDDVPPELLGNAATFPVVVTELEPSTPLAPLLAADAPERLAVIEPAPDVTVRLTRGQPVTVRFNRPMVDVGAIDHPVEPSPLSFEPAVHGVARWSSRSTLNFAPAAETWRGEHEVVMSVSRGLRSLAGESIEDAGEHTVVFAGGARVATDAVRHRVLPGQALLLPFDGPIAPQSLNGQVMVYEIGGGQRAVTFRPIGRGEDEHGNTLVDLRLGRTLEPGTRLAVALVPALISTYDNDQLPGTVDFDLAPWPRVEGIDCPENPSSAGDCTYQGPPGHIVDIHDALRLYTTNPLATVAPSLVGVTPALAGFAVHTEGNLLTIGGEWTAGQVYEVRVGALHDAEGTLLRETLPLAVRSAGRTPEVAVARGRYTFEQGSRAALPFAAVHVDHGILRYQAIPAGSEIRTLLDLLPGSYGVRGAQAYNDIPLGPMVPDARPNRWGRSRFAWLDPSAGRGATMAVVRFRPAPPDNSLSDTTWSDLPSTFVQSTDLGVTARTLPNGVLVWVTSLSTALPVEGATVTVGLQNTRGTLEDHTDESGIAWLPFTRSPVDTPSAIRVTHGDDRAAILVDPRTAVRPGAFGLAAGGVTPSLHGLVASVVTDRGAYRPGESMHVKVFVRRLEASALGPVDRGAVRVALEAPSGGPDPLVRTVQLTRFGTGDADFIVPDGAPLGDYTVTVRHDVGREVLGARNVTVAEFRQPSVRVDLQTDGEALAEGDAFVGHVTAAYLFGAPTAGALAHWTLQREPVSTWPARWSAYTFAPADAAPRAGTIATDHLTLDPHGRGDVTTHVALGAPVRQQLTLEVAVRDSSGQTTSAWHALTAYPATWEVGLHGGAPWVERGVPLDVDTIVIAHDGNPQSGRTVTARIVREGWHAYWEWSNHAMDDAAGTAGGYQARRAHHTEVVRQCALVSAEAPVHCTWTPDRPGTYVLEATTTDDEGRVAMASRRIYVAAPGEHPDRDPPGAAITVSASHPEWTVGDEARIAFESPWPEADALISVEREGLLHTERRRVAGGGVTVDFTVTPEMVPNAFVSVVLVRPRTGPLAEIGTLDLGAPDLRWGATEIAVRPHASPLDVTIDPATGTALPGSDVPVRVTVRDSDGHGVEAEVALYATDEGTLRLTSYTAPDPIAGLLPRHAPAFSMEDLRRGLVSRIDLPALPGASGDGDEAGEHGLRDARERFDPTPLWAPHLVTDRTGHAQVVCHLPDRPAQYRLMAIAIDRGSRSGRTSTNLLATRPVVLRPSLPQAVTSGDRVDAATFVHNTTDRPLDVDFVTTVGGVARSMRRLHLEAQGELRVTEPIDASGDTVDVDFDATVAGIHTTAHVRIPVAPRGHMVWSTSFGSVRGSRDVGIAFPSTALHDHGVATLTVASDPFVGLDAAMPSLADPDDDSADRAAAAVLAWTSIARLAPEKRHGGWSPSELQARAEESLSHVAWFQRADGAMGRWSSDDEPDAYLSSVALRAFVAARHLGWAVPEGTEERLVHWIRQSIDAGTFTDGGASGYDDLAAGLRALHEAGPTNATRIAAVYEQRDRLSADGLAQLAAAMEPTDRRRDTLVLAAVRRTLHARSLRVSYATRWWEVDAHATASVLEAVAVTGVGWSDVRALASQLLALRHEGTWGTAEDDSAAIQALTAYAARFHQEGALRATVSLDGHTLHSIASSRFGATYRLPFGPVSSGSHRLRMIANGTAFYSLATRWIEPLGFADLVARGHETTLHRVYETEAGVPIAPGGHVRLGDLVRVRLFTYDEGTAAPFVALRDPVPGGFEAVDHGLATTPRASLNAILGSGPDDGAIDPRGYHAMRSMDQITRRSFDRGVTVFQVDRGMPGLHEYTYAIRATSSGTFVAPPAESVALYSPSRRARSTMTTLVVDP